MYRIVGADQKEYGSVTAEQILQWIKEGRANGQSLARDEDGPWKPLSTFPEFSAVVGTSAPPPLAATAPAAIGAGQGTKTHGMAMAGLVCSLLGIVCCGPVFATLGLIFSAIALAQISNKPLQFSGKGLAWAGIIISLVDYVLFVVLIRKTDILDEILKNLPR
ncbi:MAG: DUF4190 domain-containing protein [Verrucomicrobia bacterium]|nr:DUF4190 domain-containing protein [Verrucomicrobiota bacterium]